MITFIKNLINVNFNINVENKNSNLKKNSKWFIFKLNRFYCKVWFKIFFMRPLFQTTKEKIENCIQKIINKNIQYKVKQILMRNNIDFNINIINDIKDCVKYELCWKYSNFINNQNVRDNFKSEIDASIKKVLNNKFIDNLNFKYLNTLTCERIEIKNTTRNIKVNILKEIIKNICQTYGV